MAVHPSEYDRLVESIWKEIPPEQMRNVWPTHAISYVRAMWKAETGRKMRWKVRIGTGNRRTWLQGGVFTVNPQQGWHDINHDMGHFIERRKTGGAHTNGQLNLERNGARLIVRRFLETKPPPQKAKPDMVTVRAVRVEAGIKRWEAKLRRASTALKKLKQQQRYYQKAVGS
jgi:hypothetical protein